MFVSKIVAKLADEFDTKRFYANHEQVGFFARIYTPVFIQCTPNARVVDSVGKCLSEIEISQLAQHNGITRFVGFCHCCDLLRTLIAATQPNQL